MTIGGHSVTACNKCSVFISSSPVKWSKTSQIIYKRFSMWQRVSEQLCQYTAKLCWRLGVELILSIWSWSPHTTVVTMSVCIKALGFWLLLSLKWSRTQSWKPLWERQIRSLAIRCIISFHEVTFKIGYKAKKSWSQYKLEIGKGKKCLEWQDQKKGKHNNSVWCGQVGLLWSAMPKSCLREEAEELQWLAFVSRSAPGLV